MPALPTSDMAFPLDPHDLVTLEELTLSNMWKVAAIRIVRPSNARHHGILLP